MAKDDSTDKLINVQMQQLAAQVANWAAQLDFAKERFRLLELPEMQNKTQLEIDRLAFDKAQATWENAYKEASLTGTYQGQPTMEWLTQQAQLTGVLNGTQTLQGKLTDAQITQMNEQMRLANQQFLVQTTGYMDGRPTFEREQWQTGQTGYIGDQATMARQQMEANLSGYFGGRQTLERERFGADQTQNYLQLLASLQGPGNAFKQMRVLGATDQNLQNLVSGWAGTYNMPGFGSSGAPGQAQISDLWLGSAQPGSQPWAASTGPPGMPGQWAPGAGGYPTVPPTVGNGMPAPAWIAPPAAVSVPSGGVAYGQDAPLTAAAAVQGPAAGGPPLNEAELSEYESILNQEYHALQDGRPSLIQPGSVYLTRLTAYLNRGAQNQSSTPIPGTAAGIAHAGAWQQAIYASSPTNQAEATSRPPSTTAFSWNPADAAAATAASTYMGPQYAPTTVQTPTPQGGTGVPEWYAQTMQGATNNMTVPGYTYSPQGTVAPPGAYNYSTTAQGHTQVYPPGVTAPPDQEQVSTQTPVSNATANSLLANPMPGMGGSLSPSQINAENYQKSNPYSQDFMWAWFENQGWDTQAAKGEFMKSLPKYNGPSQGTVQI